ncbi:MULTISPECIES: lysozyme inhibitor LprI family protein [Ruegeria]|uniref:lysozyme inhibitor LprI family protein n=1 Tax=Ruegeria TaxID=97050 RepID=UPI0014803C8D|nr:lysozyme inhibitor LprI family protein [Ruegeria sp. YS9]UUV04846.1 lysozyme inhibitor LprI family protein [Ruegeria sp. YS9]
MKPIYLLVLSILPCSAAAQTSCGGQTQLDANFCAKEQWEIADRELNQLWAQIKPAADARGDGDALLTEQRAWLKARDATCEKELSGGGSAAPMFYWTCMKEQTEARNQALQAWR